GRAAGGGALRLWEAPASRRSHRGDFGRRGRACVTGIYAGEEASRAWVRSAWAGGSLPPGASGSIAARRRTPRLAPSSGSSLEHAPLNERGWNVPTTISK